MKSINSNKRFKSVETISNPVLNIYLETSPTESNGTFLFEDGAHGCGIMPRSWINLWQILQNSDLKSKTGKRQGCVPSHSDSALRDRLQGHFPEAKHMQTVLIFNTDSVEIFHSRKVLIFCSPSTYNQEKNHN